MTPDQPSDPDLQTARLPDGEVCYVDEGDGLAIVALHGLPGSLRDFRWLAPVVSKYTRFIRLTLPGFGGTTCHRGPSAAQRAEVVLSALDAIGIERFVILGHSMGGIVATEVALLAPDRVAGVAFLASVGPRMHHGYRKAHLQKSWFLARNRLLRPVVLPVLKKAFVGAGFPRSTSKTDVLHTVEQGARVDFPVFAERLALLSRPTLVGFAVDDRLIEPEISDELAELAPPGPRLRFETGGHNVQKTRAIEIGESLGRWAANELES